MQIVNNYLKTYHEYVQDNKLLRKTRRRSYIHVRALVDENNVIIPKFKLSKNIDHRSNKYNKPFSPAEYYNSMHLPTLAELRHAYFSKRNGNFVSPAYRKSILSNLNCGEFTSTFLEDRNIIIERPEKLVCENGIWTAEGGTVIKTEVPDSGWVLEYDDFTGFPTRTSQYREDAENIFGDDTSYFWLNPNGLKSVFRVFHNDNHGPFYINAYSEPYRRKSIIGGRECIES